MKYTHNKRNQSKIAISIVALFVLQMLALLFKLAPNSPGQTLSWGVVFLPTITPVLIASIAITVITVRAFVAFTVKFKSDKRDR